MDNTFKQCDTGSNVLYLGVGIPLLAGLAAPMISGLIYAFMHFALKANINTTGTIVGLCGFITQVSVLIFLMNKRVNKIKWNCYNYKR